MEDEDFEMAEAVAVEADEDDAEDKDEKAESDKKEEQLTLGIPKIPSEKNRVNNVFWSKVWPMLEDIGWSKVTHKSGTLLFIPYGKDVEAVKEGRASKAASFDRIKDVLDRINKRSNEAEAAVADVFRREMIRPGKRSKKGDGTPGTRSKRRMVNASGKPSKMDLSWKDGGKHYPKRSSSVGKEYQVSEFPSAGYHKKEGNKASGEYCTLIWDPKEAEKKGIVMEKDQDIIATVPSNIKEAALLLLAEHDYDANAFKNAVNSLKPVDGSDWGPEKIKQFRDEIFRLRKDLKAVAKSMDIPMKTCLAFYFGSFKKSDSYRLVKTVCAEERVERLEANEHETDACAVCGDGGSLLICDGCEGEYHMNCMRPPLASVPDGHWECDECVDRKFLAAREYVIHSSKIFDLKDSKKRNMDQMLGAHGADESLVPFDAMLDACKTLAAGINKALSDPIVNEAKDMEE